MSAAKKQKLDDEEIIFNSECSTKHFLSHQKCLITKILYGKNFSISCVDRKTNFLWPSLIFELGDMDNQQKMLHILDVNLMIKST